MTYEIAVSGNGADGRKIVGSYRVAAEVIRVTLSDGTSTEASVDSMPVPTLAKIILQELARKSRRGKSSLTTAS